MFVDVDVDVASSRRIRSVACRFYDRPRRRRPAPVRGVAHDQGAVTQHLGRHVLPPAGRVDVGSGPHRLNVRSSIVVDLFGATFVFSAVVGDLDEASQFSEVRVLAPTGPGRRAVELLAPHLLRPAVASGEPVRVQPPRGSSALVAVR